MGTKLERKDVKVFASQPNHSTQVSAFLTGKNETPDYTLDPNAIQNTYYPKGWFGDGENDLPQGTDMNGVMYAESYKNAYLYQMGIAEWSITQEYFLNSYCQVAGTVYKSLVNNNIGNNPITDDGTNWKEIPLEPYDGGNLGTAEGIFAGKTTNNVLQFKSLAVSGNGDISSSGDTITIAIGGGGTGDVYWGAIDGTLSNQSDLQQALNLKQNLIGYTPENVTNKVTTVRDDTVATNTAYPTELATRTAIDDAITDANTYTDNALGNLNSSPFVLYANSWTDVQTGSLITTKPTGTGTTYTFSDIWDDDVEEIANFSFTTTSETRLNDTFTYDVLIPIRNANINNWYFVFTLTISHPDVNSGTETTIFAYYDPNVVTINGELDYQFKQDLINISDLVYPVGAIVNLKIMVGALPQSGDTGPYNLDLLLYDSTNPLVVSRNRGINRFYVTAFNTMASGSYTNQESFNVEVYDQIQNKQDSIQGVHFYYDNSIIKQEPDTNRTSYMGSYTHPYNYLYALQIGASNKLATGYFSTIAAQSIGYPGGNNKIVFNEDGSDIEYKNGSSQFYNAHAFYSGNKKIFAMTYEDTEIHVPLIPQANNINIGSADAKFNEGYFNTITTNEVVSGNTDSTVKVQNIRLETIRAYTPGSSIELNARILPGTDNQVILGANDRKFQAMYSYAYNGASDIRYKENIETYNEDVLDKLSNIQTITYNFVNDEDKIKRLGISAQSLQEQEPLCVNGDEYLNVDLMQFTTLLLKGIKELNEKVETLEARIEELEKDR